MSNPGELAGFQERFNARGKDRLNVRATTLRRELMHDVVDIFKIFQADDTNTEARDGSRYELWISADELEIPTRDGELQSSRSFALQNKLTDERLRFHVPIPDNMDVSDRNALDAFEIPDEIYAERISRINNVSRTMIRYAIDAHHTYTYQSPLETNDEEEINPVDLWQAFHRDFDPGIDVIVKLNQDLVNWNVTKQREVIIDPADNSVHGFDL